MKNSNNRNLVISTLLFFSIALLTSLTLIKNVEKTKLNVEEPGWISTGYYYSNLLLNRDFEWQQWLKCPKVPEFSHSGFSCGTFNSMYTPHLGQWIIGIPLKVFAANGEQEFYDFYDLGKTLEENIIEGKIPPQPILFRARSVSAVIGTLCCLLIIAIGYYSNSLWIGSIAAILLVFSNLFITLSTQVMIDISYNFFLLCACLTSIFLIRQFQLRHILLNSLLYGGFIGLASSVEITGVLIGSLYFFLLMLYKAFVYNLKVKDVAKSLTAFSLSALFIIYLTNPYYWISLKKISITETIQEVATYSKEKKEREIKKEDIRSDYPQLFSFEREMQKEKYFRIEYPQLSNFSHVLEFPLMLGRIKPVGEHQLEEVKSAQWGENRLNTFKETFFRESSSFPKESYFLLLGIILLGRKFITSIYRKEPSETAVPFLYFGVNFVFILLFMIVNFDRYYLPTIIASKLIVAVGIYETSRLIWVILGRSTKLISAVKK